jgi:hypothetical protein
MTVQLQKYFILMLRMLTLIKFQGEFIDRHVRTRIRPTGFTAHQKSLGVITAGMQADRDPQSDVQSMTVLQTRLSRSLQKEGWELTINQKPESTKFSE